MAELRELGADVQYRYFSLTKRPGYFEGGFPREEFFLCVWLRHCFGDDTVYHVSSVRLIDTVPLETTRSAIPLIKELPQLMELCLDGDALRAADIDELPCLETLENLALYSAISRSTGIPRSGRLTDAHLAPLERATRLQRLCLWNQPVGDVGVAHLRNCRQLRELDLMGTNVGNEGLTHLVEMSEMKLLNLSHTRITDEGLQNLREMNQLKFLSLNDNAIQGAGLASIGPKPHLTRIPLYNTQVNDDALRHLAAHRGRENVAQNLPALAHRAWASVRRPIDRAPDRSRFSPTRRLGSARRARGRLRECNRQ